MKLKIEIELDNDSFDPYPGSEVARILREYSARIEYCAQRDRLDLKLHDRCGHTIGSAVVINE